MKILFYRICSAMENSKINQRRYFSLNISNFVRIGRSMRSSRQNSSATMTTREYLPQPYSPTRNQPSTGAQSPHYCAPHLRQAHSHLRALSTVAWTSRSTYTALMARLTRTWSSHWCANTSKVSTSDTVTSTRSWAALLPSSPMWAGHFLWVLL